MKRHAVAIAGLAAVLALGLGGFGCSSGSSGGGSGGSGGGGKGGGGAGGGQGGGAGGGQGGGAGGSAGHGGTGGGGQDAAADAPHDAGSDALASCNPAPADQSACNSNPSCTVTCGVDVSSLTTGRPQRTCTCSGSTAAGGKWSCPTTAGSCHYPTDIDPTCFQLPSTLPACPKDPATDAGMGLIRPGITACTPPNSETCGLVCGSATAGVFSYQTAAGAPAVGYCTCIGQVYQCSSVNDWPSP